MYYVLGSQTNALIRRERPFDLLFLSPNNNSSLQIQFADLIPDSDPV